MWTSPRRGRAVHAPSPCSCSKCTQCPFRPLHSHFAFASPFLTPPFLFTATAAGAPAPNVRAHLRPCGGSGRHGRSVCWHAASSRRDPGKCSGNARSNGRRRCARDVSGGPCPAETARWGEHAGDASTSTGLCPSGTAQGACQAATPPLSSEHVPPPRARACQARRASTQQIDDSKWNHVSSSTVSAATLPAHGEWQGLVLPTRNQRSMAYDFGLRKSYRGLLEPYG